MEYTCINEMPVRAKVRDWSESAYVKKKVFDGAAPCSSFLDYGMYAGMRRDFGFFSFGYFNGEFHRTGHL